MSANKLLQPGTLVVCREDLDKLVLWESPSCDLDDVAGQVDVNEGLIILETRETPAIEKENLGDLYTEEWKNGSYYVSSRSGIKGWIGEGWVVPVTNEP